MAQLEKHWHGVHHTGLSRVHSIWTQDKQSSSSHIPYGIPQGSVLGPLLFILYVTDADIIPDKHGLDSQLYVDDVQLYFTCCHNDISTCATRISACIEDINGCMSSHHLMMNPSKTDVLYKSSASHVATHTSECQPSSNVDNLSMLSLESNVIQLTMLHKGHRHALSCSPADTVVNGLIVMRLDYCNSLPARCSKQLINKLQ